MEDKDLGILLKRNNLAVHRKYFEQMVRLIGIYVLYRAPREEQKEYDLHGELDALYCEPIRVGSIFTEYTDQKTMKKLGWNAERDETHPTLQVPYDTPGLQAGGLFIIPSGLDKAIGRVFKILDMNNSPIYPSCITCKLGPVMKNEFERSQTHDFTKTNFNVLNEEEDNE